LRSSLLFEVLAELQARALLVSRFSGDWDCSALNEPTIGFTRYASPASSSRDDRFSLMQQSEPLRMQ
jgi:hypothetical protein